MQAAIDGAAEVGFTILSMTFSLAAVFIPFLFMGGIIGKLFHEFAVTIGVAILVSGFVSLTLTPMLSSRFLKSDHGKKHGRLLPGDGALLRRVARRLRADARLGDGAPAAHARVLVRDPGRDRRTCSGPRPRDSSRPTTPGQLLATTEAAEGVSFDALVEHQQEVAAVIAKDPDVRSVTSSVGTTAAANQGQLTIDLKPIDERKRSAEQIARDLTKAVDRRRSGDHDVHPESAGDLDRRPRVEEPVPVHAAERRHQRAQHRGARRWRRACAQLPGLIDVTSDLLIENPQVTVDIDREQAGQLGVSASEIENTLYDAFGQRQVSTIYTSTNEYWVVMELLPEYQQDVDALGKLWVRSSRGPLVPLSTVAKFKLHGGSGDGEPLGAAAVGDGVVQPGDRATSLGTAVKEVETGRQGSAARRRSARASRGWRRRS